MEMLDLTRSLQRLRREFDRMSMWTPFRPSDSMLYPNPAQWKPPELKDGLETPARTDVAKRRRGS
jgi:hypothetical protein